LEVVETSERKRSSRERPASSRVRSAEGSLAWRGAAAKVASRRGRRLLRRRWVGGLGGMEVFGEGLVSVAAGNFQTLRLAVAGSG
jgi:hypothetical protein